MSNLVNLIVKYLEAVLSPILFWFVVLIVSIILFFMPENYSNYLDLTDMIDNYKSWISLFLIVSLTVVSFKVIIFIFNLIKNFEIIDTENLNDEEKAILFFLYRISDDWVNLNSEHPSVKSLKNRFFIEHAPSLIITSSKFQLFQLTKKGKKEIKKRKELFKTLNEEKILYFINNEISDKVYKKHIPQSF